jgi:putative phosphoesterase
MKIGIISDIHANIEGLNAVLEELKESEVVLCAGDIIGYNKSVNEVCEVLKKRKVEFIWGNHDGYLLKTTPPFKSEIVRQSIIYAKEHLTKENLDYIRSAGSFEKSLKIDNIKIRVFHGSPWNSSEEYIYPDYKDFSRFEGIEADLVILGHTHRPMVKKIGKLLILNPGSCGQPRDGNPDPSFAIFDTKTKEILIKRKNYGK